MPRFYSRKHTLQAKLEKCHVVSNPFIKIYKTPRVGFLQSNVRQLGSLTKNVALPMVVRGLGPAELV